VATTHGKCGRCGRVTSVQPALSVLQSERDPGSTQQADVIYVCAGCLAKDKRPPAPKTEVRK
jgi:hypothetical protein